jgi:hypothetical protein
VEALTMHGVITQIEDHGTIVQVLVSGELGGVYAVNFDHRMFWHMVEARGAERITGQAVTVEQPEDGEVLVFDDGES